MAIASTNTADGTLAGPLPTQVTLVPQDNYLLSCMTAIRRLETETREFGESFEKVALQVIVAGKTHYGLHWDMTLQTKTY